MHAQSKMTKIEPQFKSVRRSLPINARYLKYYRWNLQKPQINSFSTSCIYDDSFVFIWLDWFEYLLKMWSKKKTLVPGYARYVENSSSTLQLIKRSHDNAIFTRYSKIQNTRKLNVAMLHCGVNVTTFN